VIVVTEKESDLEPEPMDGDEVVEKPKKVKKPRVSIYRRYRSWLSTLPRRQRMVAVTLTIAGIIFGMIYLSAVIAMEPWYRNEFQEPIPKESQWIEVAAAPFEWNNVYAAEGETWTMPFDFPTDGEKGKYVAEFTAYVIWIDDARTDPDTFSFLVTDGEGGQKAAGSSSSGQTMYPARLNNTAIKHVENYQGWTIQVTCQEAKDGYLGPGGWITIPDEGNDFKVRFEWSYFIEHNPDWE
jgi:hypothetical protein